MKILFCSKCGNKLLDRFDGEYNEYTGKKILSKICSNTHCPVGCRENGGHFFSGNPFRTILSTFDGDLDPCKRCGTANFVGYGGY